MSLRSLREILFICLALPAILFLGSNAVWSKPTSDIDEIAGHLVPEKVASALSGIPEESRKLLALRSYLRFSSDLEERWSWTEAEIAAFKGTDAQLALQAEIDATHFSNLAFALDCDGAELGFSAVCS